MNQLDLIASQIRKYCAPETFQQSLERYTCNSSRSLTIARIVKIALYCIGLIPVIFLDQLMRKKKSPLSSLVVNRTVHQLTLAKDTFIKNLPESLKENWKSLAISTVILSETALLVYLRISTSTGNETKANPFLTVNGMVILAALTTAFTAAVKLRSSKAKEVSSSQALHLVAPQTAEAENASTRTDEVSEEAEDKVIEKLLFLHKEVDINCLQQFPLILQTVEKENASAHADEAREQAEEKALNAQNPADEALQQLLQDKDLPKNLRAAEKKLREEEKFDQAEHLESFVKLLETAQLQNKANENEVEQDKEKVRESLLELEEKVGEICMEFPAILKAAEAENAFADADEAREQAEEKALNAGKAADAALQQLLQDKDLPKNLRAAAETLRKEEKSDQAEILKSFAESLDAAAAKK